MLTCRHVANIHWKNHCVTINLETEEVKKKKEKKATENAVTDNWEKSSF